MGWITLIVSVATLVAVLWQIARLESLQPTDGLAFRDGYDGASRNGISSRDITIRAMGPATLYEVTYTVVGARPHVAPVGPMPTVTPDSEPVTLQLSHPDEARPFVVIQWVAFTRLRGRPVLQARRYDVVEERLLRWQWSRVPWRRDQGKWVHRQRKARYTLPDEAIRSA